MTHLHLQISEIKIYFIQEHSPPPPLSCIATGPGSRGKQIFKRYEDLNLCDGADCTSTFLTSLYLLCTQAAAWFAVIFPVADVIIWHSIHLSSEEFFFSFHAAAADPACLTHSISMLSSSSSAVKMPMSWSRKTLCLDQRSTSTSVSHSSNTPAEGRRREK